MKAQDRINGNPGDMIWAKNRGAWWPAQVVEENLISESCKPSKPSTGNVLVRLYGTYTFCYVDPVKWRSEFPKVLEQNNGSCRQVLSKSLDKDVSSLRTSDSKRQRSKGSKGKESRKPKPKDSDRKEKKPNSVNRPSRGIEEKNRKRNSSSPEACLEPGELTGRRLKVMRCLGLAAPSGSPFGKNRESQR